MDAYDVRAAAVPVNGQKLAGTGGGGEWERYVDVVGYQPGSRNPDDMDLEQAWRDIDRR